MTAGNGGDGASVKEKATDVLSDCLHPDDAVNMVLDSLRVEEDVEADGISREEVTNYPMSYYKTNSMETTVLT